MESCHLNIMMILYLNCPLMSLPFPYCENYKQELLIISNVQYNREWFKAKPSSKRYVP